MKRNGESKKKRRYVGIVASDRKGGTEDTISKARALNKKVVLIE